MGGIGTTVTIGKKYRPNTSLFSHCLNFQPRVDTLPTLPPFIHPLYPSSFGHLSSSISLPLSLFSFLFSQHTLEHSLIGREIETNETRHDETGNSDSSSARNLKSERLRHRKTSSLRTGWTPLSAPLRYQLASYCERAAYESPAPNNSYLVPLD